MDEKLYVHVPLISNTAIKTFCLSLFLIGTGFFLGCDSIRQQTNVTIQDTSWHVNGEPVNAGSPAEGLLMNVRMVNTVFEDRGPELAKRTNGFDPKVNTDAFIGKMPEYISSGVNAFTLSLQGGMPGYESAINTAFHADGSLRESYLQRVERVIRAADVNGAAIILSLFYQRQHSHVSALSGKQSIRNALENTVGWITEKGFSNVVLEVSNEYRHGGFRSWQDGQWLMSEEGQVELIQRARQHNPELLVSTGGMGDGRYPEALAKASDFILIHFNTTSLDLYESRIDALKKYGKPIVCNEDDKLGLEGSAAQAIAVKNGSGWGYMGMLRNQYFPFEFLGVDDDPQVYKMYRNLTTPGFENDPESLEYHSIAIGYPQDGEIIRLGQPIEINLAHLYSDEAEASSIVLLANNEQIAELDNGIRLRVSWKPGKPGIYDLQAVVRDVTGNERYRSAGVDIIVRSGAGGTFPAGQWEQATPQSQGVDAQKLDEAVRYLEQHSGSDGIRELVIIRNGRMIWGGPDIDKMHNVWSMTKSFTSTVLGLLIDDGQVTPDTRAAKYAPELADDYSEVTLRHFTTMTSGYMAEGDQPEVTHGQSSTPFIPSAKPLFAPPGSKYAYWDSAVNQFAHVLTRVAGEPIRELFRRRIADPIGIDWESWDWKEFEHEKQVINGGAGNKGKGIHISARELARFGHLFLNQGRWEDRQLISTSWVEAATSVQIPASVPLGHEIDGVGMYGYNWWVNGPEDGRQKWPDAPSGTYAASGFNNNDMFVIPSWQMVIVRLGLDQEEVEITDEVYNIFLQKIGQAVN